MNVLNAPELYTYKGLRWQIVGCVYFTTIKMFQHQKKTKTNKQTNKKKKPVGHSKSSSKREVYSNSISPQETRKISNKQSNPTLKTTREGFPGGAVVESLPANAGDTGSSPGLGGSHMPQSGWAREPQLLSLRV